MKNLLLSTTAMLALAACTPDPICDREAQAWDKFTTVSDKCVETSTPPAGDPQFDGPATPEPQPEPEPEPTPEPEPEPEPEDDVHEDNGGGNGVDPAPGGSDDGNGDQNGDGET